MSDLIDTTQMYLRTVYELQEEGVVPLRARIAERLGQSGPTVSQTVSRMARDGLLVVSADRQIELTVEGERQAMRVMRKHRLVERLLLDVIGLDWESVHDEACRWEHVVSDKVEQRLLVLLDGPTELAVRQPDPRSGRARPRPAPRPRSPGVPLDALALEGAGRTARIARIAEALQEDAAVMAELNRAGAVPGATVEVSRDADGRVRRGRRRRPGGAERRAGRPDRRRAPDVTRGAVLWLRRDLRLADHPALHASLAHGPAVPVFVIDPALWGPAGGRRRGYLAASLADLDARIRDLGGPGVSVLTGDPAQVVPAFADGRPVHATADAGPYGRRRDAAVAEHADLRLVGSPSRHAPG